MSNLYWLTDEQMERLKPFFPTDAKGRPLKFFMTAGQVSDYTGAAALLGSLPAAEWMIADRGYDADWFRDALKDNLSLVGPLWVNGARKRSVGLSSRLFRGRLTDAICSLRVGHSGQTCHNYGFFLLWSSPIRNRIKPVH